MQLYGLEKDIHITDKQYLLTLTVFFISWALELFTRPFTYVVWVDIQAIRYLRLAPTSSASLVI